MALILPEPVAELSALLNQLPGIGPRSAERLALHLIQADRDYVRNLADCLLRARERVTACTHCGALTEKQPCEICASPVRDATMVCVVERPLDILSLEKSGAFRGRYHVLGGRLSPLNGVGPEDLAIHSLENRVRTEGIKEVILGLGSDVEGDATSFYLARQLSPLGARITRLAQGLPAGGGLEFADELTLGRAIEGRREMT